MSPVPALSVLAVLVCAAPAPAQPAGESGEAYAAIRANLEAARPAGAVRTTASRLLRDERIRNTPSLRLFVTGVAAMLSYDRKTADRDLTRSFDLAPSPHVALALTANAIEMGDAEAAMTWADRGMAAAGAALDPRMKAELLLARAQGLIWLMRYGEHAAHVAEAIDLARRLGDRRLIALGLRSEGVILGESGRREALDRFEEAARLSEGDPRAMGYHLLLMNTFYYLGHPYAEKVPLLDRVLVLARQTRDRQLEGRALGARGAALRVLARYGEALRDLTAADALLRETGAVRSRAAAAGNLSLLLTDLGDYPRADEQARLAFALYRQVRNPAGARMSLDDLGHIALLQGQPATAVRRHEQAVALSRQLGDGTYLRTALTRLGLAYMTQQRWEPAERVLQEALQLAEDGRYPDERESARIAMADLLRATGRTADAAAAYREALAAAPGLAYAATLLVRGHHGLGRLEAGAGRLESALQHYRLALAGIEQARTGAGSAELRLTYFADKTALYVDAIDVLVEAHRRTGDQAHLGEAFLVSERAKARTLVDAVAGGGDSGAGAFASVGDLADTLEPSDVLIEYVAGAHRSFALTLRRDRTLTVHELPARAALDEQVDAIRRLIAERPRPSDRGDDVRLHASRAFATLLAPALRGVAPDSRLLIVADGRLFYAPFEAFVDPATGQFVGETFEVVRAASASVLHAQRGRPESAGPPRLVAFGDPRVSGEARADDELVRALERDGFSFAPLPGSRREVEEAAAAFGAADTRIYTGEAFTRAAALAALQQPYGIVHFATHAILDERVPERSGIVTSAPASGGAPIILRARELAELRIPADLVVLSGCQTGLGAVVNGEGVLGLSWALTRAGVASLVVTMWNVSDAAGAPAMAAFYRALAAGQTKAAALRTARRELLAGPNRALHHPYFWAGYALIGNPR
ncbi:MAG: CHAT domain-containing tetratricopeptide repeat protein [Acidobacteriota bacterium]